MESFSGDNEEGTEDVTKRKSSKIKSLKSRFFRRTKKTGAEADAKLSQSASDITAGKGLGSDEDLASQGTMGSRAFSHESIFLDDQVLSDPDPVKVSSQENVHSKIKSLQMKLQLQKMHFGPPPMVLPIRSPEETAQQSEDFTFHGSNENSGEGTFTKSTSQPISPPVSPISKWAQTRSPSQMPSHHFSVSGPNYSSPATAEAPVDFSTPANFNASLDTSALRHRMSIKPRNQRASSKRKPSPGIESGSPLRDLKVRARFERVQEQEQEVVAQEGETVETEKGQANLSQISPLTFGELSPVSSEVASKLPSQDNALPEAKAFPILRVKPPGQLDASPTQRPHSSYIDSEIKEKKELDLERQVTSQNKRNAFFASMTELSSEQLSPFSSWLTSRSPLTQQQQQPKKDEDISTRIKRQSSGSDSFRLSGNWDEERPRSGSFTGLQEKSKPRTKSFGVAEEKIAKEREELKSLTGSLEKPEARSRSFERIEEKITREKEELKCFTGFPEKPEAKTREFGGTEAKITREREDLKSATGFSEKPEARTRSFEGTEEKITKQKEEAKNFTGFLENPEAKTRSFGGTEEKITREKEEVKSFTGFLEKPEVKTRPSGVTEEKKTKQREELKNFTGILEKPEAKTRPFGGTEEKITREKEEVKSFTGWREKSETKSRQFGGTEEKITKEKEEAKNFTGFLEKPEAKTRPFGGTEEKITKEKEEAKHFTEFLEKPEAKTRPFGGTEEKITREKEEVKSFTGFLEKPEVKTRPSGVTEEKKTKQREELKNFTGVLEKPEAKTRPFGGTEEKITTEKEEVKSFTGWREKSETKSRQFGGTEEKNTSEIKELKNVAGFLEKHEAKTRSFGGTEEKTTKEKEEAKHFTEFLEKPEVKTRPFGATEEKTTREREEVKSLQPKGSPFAADRAKGSSLPWERHLSYKKVEPVTTARNLPLDTYVAEVVRVVSTPEVGDEAAEAKELPEDETRTPFGVKLRSTSRSFKFRSETASQRHSATLLSDDQDVDTKKRQKMVDGSSQISEKILANTSSSPRSPDPAPFGVTLPDRRNASLEESSQTTPVEVQTTSIHLGESETATQETQPSPQASSSDVSWVSLAMEKTRSLQHLLTRRFQRDFTGTQTGARPKSQEETITGPQVQNQTVKTQQSTPQLSSDKIKEESVQSSGQEQAVKPSTPASQKKMTMITQFESCSSRDSPIPRQTSHCQTQPNRAQSDAQAIPRTNHSPSPSSPLIGNTSPFTFTRRNAPPLLAQPYQSSPQQQTCWTSQGLQPATQLKHVPSALESEPAVTSAAAPTLDFALERREKESSVPREGPSLVSKRVLWTGSAADRFAFMEKRAEWTTPPLLKEVEQKKSQAQMQTSSDTDTLAYLFPLSKDTVEIRQVAKSAESSPSRVIEKPREDKWTRKNVELPSSPSSLRTHSSALHSDSSQPSWMEMAKRKSMAWSDKSMD